MVQEKTTAAEKEVEGSMVSMREYIKQDQDWRSR